MRCYYMFFWSIRNFFDFTLSRPRNKLPPSVWLRDTGEPLLFFDSTSGTWLRNTGDLLLFFNSTSGTIRKPKREQRQTRNENN